MNNEYDFTRVGKQMPYNVPEGFFDEMEDKVWQQVFESEELRMKSEEFPTGQRAAAGTAAANSSLFTLHSSFIYLAIAASIALVVVLNIFPASPSAPSMGDIDQAFAQLTVEDQDYLMAIYQDDVFMDDEMEQ